MLYNRLNVKELQDKLDAMKQRRDILAKYRGPALLDVAAVPILELDAFATRLAAFLATNHFSVKG